MNENEFIDQNFKTILKENLYKYTRLSLKEKQKIVEIIQKEKYSQNDKNELISMLEKLTSEDLKKILPNRVKKKANSKNLNSLNLEENLSGILENEYKKIRELAIAKCLTIINRLNLNKNIKETIEANIKSLTTAIIVKFQDSKRKIHRLNLNCFAGAIIFHIVKNLRIKNINAEEIAKLLGENIESIYKFRNRNLKPLISKKRNRLFYLNKVFGKYPFPNKCKELAILLLDLCKDKFDLFNNKTIGISIGYLASVIYEGFNIPTGSLKENFDIDPRTIYGFLGDNRFNSILETFYESNLKSNNFNIQRKTYGSPSKYRYINDKGYIVLLMPPEYRPPDVKVLSSGNVKRYEHIVIIENHLVKHPELDVSKNCLIENKYLKSNCVVHHINHDPSDNRLSNLWVYENHLDHMKLSKGSLYECFSGLIKLGQVKFSNGIYYLNKNFDYKTLSKSEFQKIIEPQKFEDYEDLEKVKKVIKEIDWNKISSDWTIFEKNNQYTAKRKINLNPYEDSSKSNPLYKHKKWVETVVSNDKIRLSDARLAKLCGIQEHTAYSWRHLVHKIPSSWGLYRVLKESGGGKKYILIKLPKNYKNPYAKKLKDFNAILEHRYIIENYLKNHLDSQLSKDCLYNGKYLKPNCKVHHINLDTLDNRLNNLWIVKNHNEHNSVHYSLFDLIKILLEKEFLIFENGKYRLNF